LKSESVLVVATSEVSMTRGENPGVAAAFW
jgi:hypothetical protein